LLAGIEPNQALFADLLKGLFVLERTEDKNLQNIEVILVLRILNNLGYIGEEAVLQNLIKSPFEENLIYEVSKSKREALNQINKALKETHL
jgi:hypothetical protein